MTALALCPVTRQRRTGTPPRCAQQRRRIPTALAAQAICALAVFGASRALAEPRQNVVLLGVQAQPQLAAQVSAWLSGSVARLGGFRLSATKNLDEIKLVFGCVDEEPACMARVGRDLGADKVVWGSVDDALLTLRVVDVKTARLERDVQGHLEQPAVEAALVELLLPRLGALRLRCNVRGARVRIGTVVRGTTTVNPLLIEEVSAGLRLVRVDKPGYRTFERRVEVPQGATIDLSAALEREDVGASSGRVWWRTAFFGSLGAALGLGAGVLAGGLSVRGLERDKTAELERVLALERAKAPGDPTQLPAAVIGALSSPGRDACAVAGQVPGSTLNAICDQGRSRAALVTGLAISAGACAALSGYLFYRAYLAREPDAPTRAPALSLAVDTGGVAVDLSWAF